MSTHIWDGHENSTNREGAGLTTFETDNVRFVGNELLEMARQFDVDKFTIWERSARIQIHGGSSAKTTSSTGIPNRDFYGSAECIAHTVTGVPETVRLR